MPFLRLRRSSYRGLLRAGLAVLALTACAHGAGGPHTTGAPPKGAFEGPLPDIEVSSLDGHTKNLRDLTKGKVAVVDMWATWCSSCRDVSARAAELSKSETPDKLVVIGIDEGEDAKDVLGFLTTPNTPYPIYVDTEYSLANEVRSETVPTILIVDRTGKVRAVTHKLDARAVRIVGELLAEGEPSAAPTPAP
jgi:thiol-disulfide isomerase/thioredoxin